LTDRFFIDQHGCAKNQIDGELIAGLLTGAGMVQTFSPEEASLIIVNSCGFIESAKKESLDAVCSIRAAYPGAKILLAGCLAQRYASELEESMPELDGIFGNGKLDSVVQAAERILRGERVKEVYAQEGVCAGARPVLFNYRGSAFVKITEGCSNHCSFCAIPLIRGELRSRTADDIADEIRQLVEGGIYEINLVGQDLAAYGTGAADNVFGDGRTALPVIDADGNNLGTAAESGLCRLLRRISGIPGDFAVRLLYIHPDHFNKDIIPVIKSDSRFLRYFDIPFQSGDDRIIRAMNRKGSAASYIALAEMLREELPGCVLRTTFLTGFPGETSAEADNTCSFLKKLKSDWSGCFPYSREEDTPAYSMKRRVSSREAERRAAELGHIQSEITAAALRKYVGTETDVIVEEIVRADEGVTDGLAIGRAWFQAPEVDGNVVIRYESELPAESEAVFPGNVVRVRILAVAGVDLDARFLSPVRTACGGGRFKFLYE